MTSSEKTALVACENDNAVNVPYRPGPSFAGCAARLERDGLIMRGSNGGFWLTNEGERKLVQIRAITSATRRATRASIPLRRRT